MQRRRMFEMRDVVFQIVLFWQIINFSLHQNACFAMDGNLCTSEVCKETASFLLRNVDKSVQPCDDFYNFACGNFMRSFTIPKDKLKVNAITQLQDQIDFQLRRSITDITKKDMTIFQNLKSLYESCMDEDIEGKSDEEFQKVVKSFGSWPVLEKSWENTKFDWKQLMYRLQRAGFSSNSFINVQLAVRSDDHYREAIEIRTTGTALSSRVLSRGPEDPTVKKYFDFMTDVAVVLGADFRRALVDLGKSLEFEIALAKINLEFLNKEALDSQSSRRTIKELQAACPSIPWPEYLTKTLPRDVRVDESTNILSISPRIINSYCKLFDATPKRTLANYAFFHMAVDSLPYLNSRLRRLHQTYEDLSKRGPSPIRGSPRWRVCVAKVKDLMPVVAGSLYVRKHFDRRNKAAATKLASYIERSVRDSLKKVSWMHPKDQATALDKMTAMISVIAYPTELLEDSEIRKFYKKLTLTRGQSFLKAVLTLNLFNVKLYHSKLAAPFNVFHWAGSSGHAAEVDAKYIPSHNVFHIMAGVLQGIFFNVENPKYINFAGIGSTVGHEIMHAFDDCDEQLTDPGKYYRNCWNPGTVRRFREKTECLVNQYDDIARAKNLQVNGRDSLEENIADNAGVRHAYLAYNQWVKDYGSEPRLQGMEEYSPKQMFWLAYANTYCEWAKPGAPLDYGIYAPNQLRVNGPLINMPEFAQDFSCPAGSFMNTSKKCSVW